MNTQESLSIVLPVHNASRQLAERVVALLEILPEITHRFEVLIVDNGSTDQTEEVAHDLARDFPQLKVARHARRETEDTILETGLRHTSGDLIVVYQEQAPIRPGELHRMWQLRRDQQLVFARPAGKTSMSLFQRLAAWASKVQHAPIQLANEGGLQIIRRRAMDELLKSPASDPGENSQRPGTGRPRPSREPRALVR